MLGHLGKYDPDADGGSVLHGPPYPKAAALTRSFDTKGLAGIYRLYIVFRTEQLLHLAVHVN